MRKLIETLQYDGGLVQPHRIYVLEDGVEMKVPGPSVFQVIGKVANADGLVFQENRYSVVQDVELVGLDGFSAVWVHRCKSPGEDRPGFQELDDPGGYEDPEFDRFREWAARLGLVPASQLSAPDQEEDFYQEFDGEVDHMPLDTDSLLDPIEGDGLAEDEVFTEEENTEEVSAVAHEPAPEEEEPEISPT